MSATSATPAFRLPASLWDEMDAEAMRIDAMLESGDFSIHAANDPAEVEVEWRALQENAFGTLFTSYDWLSSWQQHVGRARGIEALIVVGMIEGKPAFLLPLGLMRAVGGTLTIARFLADFHGNQNSGLWRRDILAGIHGRTLRKALITIGRRHGIDLFDLKYVPAEINGRVHPLVDQTSIESLNAIHALPLTPDFDALYKARRSASARKKLRTKEKKLGQLGPVRIERARDATTALSFLDTLIAQRSARQESSGIPNVFEPDDVRAFLSEQLTKALDHGSDSFMIHALLVGDTVKATYLSGLQFNRFHAYTNSISEDVAACSPGDILLNHVIAEACALGAEAFDFGLGAERYKTAWADKEVLMDVEIPVTLKGRCAEMSVQALRNSKRYIRNSPRLWAIVRRLRRLGLPL